MPGVYFFSLDATQPLAIWGARTFFHLPYLRAEMSMEADGEALRYRSTRTDPRAPPGTFTARDGPNGPVVAAGAGSLEAFLTERDCLYTVNRAGEPLRGHIQPGPWPLPPASRVLQDNTVISVPIVPVGAPRVHFARRLDVVAWPLDRI